MTPKTETGDPALRTWIGLNKKLMKSNEAMCARLLEIERANRDRKMFKLRIHSRMNILRAQRERRELLAPGAGRG
jgi:hypothetical protein